MHVDTGYISVTTSVAYNSTRVDLENRGVPARPLARHGRACCQAPTKTTAGYYQHRILLELEVPAKLLQETDAYDRALENGRLAFANVPDRLLARGRSLLRLWWQVFTLLALGVFSENWARIV